MLAPASIDKSACIPAGIMSPGLGPAELLRNCLLDWAPSGANKKLPPGLGPGSFPKKLQWGPVFLCQIEYGVPGCQCRLLAAAGAGCHQTHTRTQAAHLDAKLHKSRELQQASWLEP